MVCNVCKEKKSKEDFIPQTTVCISCQSNTFKRIEQYNGSHLALFITCAAYNIPFYPVIVPIDISNYQDDKWQKYINLLKEQNKLLTSKGSVATFSNGAKNIREIFGIALSETDFSRYVAREQSKITSTAQGSEEQRARWGTAPLCKGYVLTDETYQMLDEQLGLWRERYKGVNSPQLESTLITICKRNAVADFLFKEGNYADAAKVQKMVDDLMASEQMRKKDEKPVEHVQMDALVLALEKAGMMEEGNLLTFDELIEVMRDRFVKSHKYQYSLDVADQMIMDYYNNLRANAEMDIVTSLPNSMQPQDEYGEFAPIESDEEKKRKRYAGLTPVRYED